MSMYMSMSMYIIQCILSNDPTTNVEDYIAFANGGGVQEGAGTTHNCVSIEGAAGASQE